MQTPLLVIGIASSALFDLKESDLVFREQGRMSYRKYQKERLNDPLSPGVAFPFIRRLLSLNERLGSNVVEVVLLSKNDSNTGLRVMRSIEHHGLNIERAVFLQGKSSIPYLDSFGVSLFLSGDEDDIEEAIKDGSPSGLVLGSNIFDDPTDMGIRIAFDFDGVIADDESEIVFRQQGGLDAFVDHETKHAETAHGPGPLKRFIEQLSKLQKFEIEQHGDENFEPMIEISIVTARGAPCHERVIHSMSTWDIEVNRCFFLAGMKKSKILSQLKPHMYFDDQLKNLEDTVDILPSVHVPFGIGAGKMSTEAKLSFVEEKRA
jgi:5'-nucleotidase